MPDDATNGGAIMKIDGMKLRMELYRQGISQIEFAALTGYSRQHISNIIHGLSCSQKAAERIAKALGVGVAEILEDKRLIRNKGTVMTKREMIKELFDLVMEAQEKTNDHVSLHIYDNSSPYLCRVDVKEARFDGKEGGEMYVFSREGNLASREYWQEKLSEAKAHIEWLIKKTGAVSRRAEKQDDADISRREIGNELKGSNKNLTRRENGDAAEKRLG